MAIGICKNCKKEKKDIRLSGVSAGLCNVCYRRLIWRRKNIECKRCGRMLPNHAKGFCAGCYNSIFQIEKVRDHNIKKYHNIDLELYHKVISKCAVCDFDKLIQMHHLNHDKTDNSETNLLGLCPNHHKMIHSIEFQQEVFDILKHKGFSIPEFRYKTDNFF